MALLAIALAFGFLGSRGIWDPDEGRYTNVAINMLESGDWLNPRRNEDIGHWTKPPLTYWAIAASVGTFGLKAWAARLPVALSYLLCVWLAWRIARRLAPGAEMQAAVVYATMFVPFGASQLITTDYLLAASQALAMWGFVEARFAASARPKSWITLMWLGFALGFLTKGPPALLTLLVVLGFDLLIPGPRTHRIFTVSGLVLFALLALPWYIAVFNGNPGLFEYFIGDETINRVTTDEFGRNGEWYGWAKVYVPTLLLGTLPWTPALLRWARALPASLRRWRGRDRRAADARALLLALWVLLPLLVFCIARSRMPLYLLPLFLPLALIIAQQRQSEGRGLPHWRWLAAWATVLLALKLASAYWPTHKNSAEWARQIEMRAPGRVGEVIFVEDMARYGLRLHLDAEIEKIALGDEPGRRFNPDFDEPLSVELEESAHERGAIWVCKQAFWPDVRARVAAKGQRAIALGAPYQGRVIFRVVKSTPPL